MPLLESAPQRMRFTRERFDAMIAAGVLQEDDRVELMDGEIYSQRPPGSRHIARTMRIQKCLEQLIGSKALISVQNPIALGELSEPQPDVAVLKLAKDFYESRLPECEDILWVVEVSDSTLAFDRNVKLPRYAAGRIPEVWIMDVELNHLTIYRAPEKERYLERTVYAKGSRIPLAAFPGRMLLAEDLGL